MGPEVKDAIENARTAGADVGDGFCRRVEPQRRRSFGFVRALVLAVAQELPGEMTMTELCDELGNANNQGPQP